MAGCLYMVPTPVGNLEDMTPRAIETLRHVSLVLCEDTRTSAVLLRHFSVETPCRSFHKFNEHNELAAVVDRIESGDDIALISDAGTPGISDPGFMLSRECRRRNIAVVTLPGATAFVPAMISSGLPCERFCFEGFLPVKKGRATRLSEIAAETRTTIIYESPVRLVRTLEQLAETCGGDRQASVSREISKLHETTIRGSLDEIIAYFKQNQPRGEIVIILGGRQEPSRAGTHKNKYRDNQQEN